MAPAMRNLTLVTVVALVVLAGCGGGDDEGDSVPSASPTAETQASLPWPPPTASSLLGKWSRVAGRDTLVAWFRPDGTFSI
jgi:hypothetical protein